MVIGENGCVREAPSKSVMVNLFSSIGQTLAQEIKHNLGVWEVQKKMGMGMTLTFSPLIPALWRQRQAAELHKVEASLPYRTSSRTARDLWRGLSWQSTSTRT